MERGATGRYVTTTVSGEAVRAFVPAPLPPSPPVALDRPLQRALEGAILQLGRLDGASSLFPDKSLFLYSYVRKEAVLSSQIEGTQSSLSDLLLFEADEAPGVPLNDVVEVSRYVAALDHGLARLREGFPLSGRLLREIHEVLLSEGRGSDKRPGEFRQSQNWLGGTRPGNATVVPPPHADVAECITELERFLHDEANAVPVVLRAAFAHVQFETIHPFLDGNGRVGRLLITLLLCDAGVLRDPLLYLSLYLKRHRSRYYELLDRVRATGDWEAWVRFFLDGVHDTARDAVQVAETLSATFRDDRARLAASGRRAASAIQVHDALKERPIRSLSALRAATELSFPAVSSAVDLLIELGIARELTGKRRNRLFAYDRYLALLNEGTEPL